MLLYLIYFNLFNKTHTTKTKHKPKPKPILKLYNYLNIDIKLF